MNCREGCGACCIAPSISSSIPGMENGKKAGERCINLTSENKCAIFNSPDRPKVCSGLKPSLEMCGEANEYAMDYLEKLEKLTSPR